MSRPRPTGRGMPRLTAALAAVRRGWPVLPLHPYRKHPAIVDWDEQATVDLDQVHRWWISAAYNVGIACGPAGLVVLDLDSPDHAAAGEPGTPPTAAPSHRGDVTVAATPSDGRAQPRPHGRDVLAALADDAGEPDPVHTYTVATPGGGEHRYFAAPPEVALRNTAGQLGPHIDTRAAGGYVVAAGSVARVGRRIRRYRVLRDLPVAPLPEWLVDAAAPPPEHAPAPLPADHRHLTAYVRAAVRGESQSVAHAVPGSRNHTLFVAAARLGELVGAGVLDESVAATALLHAAERHVGVEGFTRHEAQRTITNGLTTGRRNPRPVTASPATTHAGPDGSAVSGAETLS
jgi:hypothetical protein